LLGGLPRSYNRTHFSGTVLTYGIVFLSTNEPKPSLKFCVMFFILSADDITTTHLTRAVSRRSPRFRLYNKWVFEDLCNAKVSEENQGALRGPLGGRIGWVKVVRLTMASKRRLRLGLAGVKRWQVPYFGCSDAKSASAKWQVVVEQKVRGAIKKFLVWPGYVQNKIKIVFASYSSKAQNMTCTIWLLSCRYSVHFSGRRLSAVEVEKSWFTQCNEMTILTDSFVPLHALLFWLRIEVMDPRFIFHK